MNRIQTEMIVRAIIWIVFIAIWAYLNKPQDGGLLTIQPALPGVIGFSLIGAGVSLYVWSTRTFAVAKKDTMGTPRTLITNGPYRYVRNPIYLSVAMILAGVSALYGAWGATDIIIAIVMALAVHFAVVYLEEPATRRQFGVSYDEYCKNVWRWMPHRSKLPRQN